MSVKRNKIIVGSCSAAALIALVVGLSVGLTQCSNGNDGDTSTSSHSGTSSKSDATTSSSSNSSSNSSSQGGNSSSSSSSSSSTHTHDYGATWKSDANSHWHECSADGAKSDEAAHSFGDERVVITPASESAPGTKAYKCSVCGYTKDLIEYNPRVNSDTWGAALKIDSDFKVRNDYYYYYTPNHKNTHDVIIQTRHGNILKVSEDNYSYGDGFSYGSEVKWYEKIPDESAIQGFECVKYKYDEANANWTTQEDFQFEWNYYGTVDYSSDFAFNDFSYDEADECYKKSVRTEENELTETENLYFDSGKLIKRVSISAYDSGETTTDVFEFEYTTDELSLPGAGENHIHDFSEAYSSDSLYHWHECSCGVKKDKTPHEFDGYSVIKKATKTTNGTKSATCETCSGNSGEREYNPYMDNFDWSEAFASYLQPYSLKVITEKDRVGVTTEIVRYDATTLECTEMFLPTAGSGREDTKYYTQGTTSYDYVISKDSSGNWVKTTDADNHWKNSALTVFSSYNTSAYEKDKLTLVENGDDIHYVSEDSKVTIYFDLGRIVKLVDKTDSSSTKTITVSYSDLYEIEVPDYAI